MTENRDPLAIIAGHISAIRTETVARTNAGQRHAVFIAEVTSPGGTFDIPISNADGLLDADVEITVRISYPSVTSDDGEP